MTSVRRWCRAVAVGVDPTRAPGAAAPPAHATEPPMVSTVSPVPVRKKLSASSASSPISTSTRCSLPALGSSTSV
jgi:hypothetical protein